MVNQSKKFTILLISLVLAVLGMPNVVNAEDSPGNFGVSAVLPDNQIDKNIGYFDLLVTPKQEQTIEIKLNNNAETKRTFDVNVNAAVTSDGGTIDYSQRDVKLDPTVPFDVRKVITLEKNEFEVEGKTEVTIPIKIIMPEKSFKGRVLAGINVMAKESDDKSQKSDKNSVAVKNKIAYNLAIVLRESRDPIEPDLKLQEGKLENVNSYPTIQFKFQNPTPTIISNLVFTTKVSLDGEKYVENTSSEYLVAPNTAFHLNLDLNNSQAEPGKYKANIVAKDKDGHEWKFTKEFEVKGEKAQELNQTSVLPKKDNTLLMIVSVLLVIALALIVILLMKRRKKEE